MTDYKDRNCRYTNWHVSDRHFKITLRASGSQGPTDTDPRCPRLATTQFPSFIDWKNVFSQLARWFLHCRVSGVGRRVSCDLFYLSARARSAIPRYIGAVRAPGGTTMGTFTSPSLSCHAFCLFSPFRCRFAVPFYWIVRMWNFIVANSKLSTIVETGYNTSIN